MATLLWLLLAWLAVSEAKKNHLYDKTTCGLPHKEYLRKHPEYKFDLFEDDNDDDDPMRRKIMGGVRAEKGELPWSILIEINSLERVCGGTLITKRHVISAAHCFWNTTGIQANEEEGCNKDDGLLPEDVTKMTKVLVGGTCTTVNPKMRCTKQDVGVEMGIKRAYYQGFFDKGCKFTNDIAILELSEDVPDGVNHICLPFIHDNVKELGDPSIQLSSSGWGADPGKKLFYGSPFLQIVRLGAAMPEKLCKKLIPYKSNDTFCTYERPDTNVCNGDSGGGIIATVRGRSYVMGVVSYGTDCADLNSAAQAPLAQANTNVMHYVSLIKEKTGLKDKNLKD